MGDSKIQFRLESQDSDEIKRRKEPNTSESIIARRDLGRYYMLLRNSLPTFKQKEALLLCDALKEPFSLHPHDVHLVWAEVSNAHRLGKLEHRNVDIPALVERLQKMTDFESMAIYDAIEQFWHSEYFKRLKLDDGEILHQVGLIVKDQDRKKP